MLKNDLKPRTEQEIYIYIKKIDFLNLNRVNVL